jgi:hypothetical protein
MTVMLLLGYVGPGAGLGFLGSLLAILAVVAIGLAGLVVYPLKLIISLYRGRSAMAAPDNAVQDDAPANRLMTLPYRARLVPAAPDNAVQDDAPANRRRAA